MDQMGRIMAYAKVSLSPAPVDCSILPCLIVAPAFLLISFLLSQNNHKGKRKRRRADSTPATPATPSTPRPPSPPEEPSPPPQRPSGESIFDDAGPYVCLPAKKRKTDPASLPGSYFEIPSQTWTPPVPVREAGEVVRMADGGNLVARDHDAMRRETDTRERDPSFVSDSYSGNCSR